MKHALLPRSGGRLGLLTILLLMVVWSSGGGLDASAAPGPLLTEPMSQSLDVMAHALLKTSHLMAKRAAGNSVEDVEDDETAAAAVNFRNMDQEVGGGGDDATPAELQKKLKAAGTVGGVDSKKAAPAVQKKVAQVKERSMEALGDGNAAGDKPGWSWMQKAGYGFGGYLCLAMIVLGVFVLLDKMGVNIGAPPRGAADDDESSSTYRTGASTA